MTEILDQVRRLRQDAGGAASVLELLLRATTLPMASRSDLEGRVLAILDPRRNHRSLERKTCYALMFLAVLFLIPCAILRLGYAQDKKPPDQPSNAKGAAESVPLTPDGSSTATKKEQPRARDESTDAAVDVLVVAPGGRPVADAEVQAYDTSRSMKSYRTDQRGAFRIPGKWLNADSDMYFLVSRKGESLGWRWLGCFHNPDVDKPAAGQPLRITLAPCDRTIEGNCVDRAGRPMAKVPLRVILLGNRSNEAGPCSPCPECLGHGISDAEGHYSIKVPEYKFCNLVAEHPDYVPVEASYRADSPGARQIVLKEPAGMVRGRVVDAATGLPISGARIFAQAIESRIGYAGFRESVSDENGQYTLASMAPGSWNVLFGRFPEKPDWTAVAADSLEVKAGEAARADFRAGPGRLLSGQVIDAEKNVPLIGVSVGYYGSARPRSGAACTMVKTNAQGRFEFHVPPGESYVYVAQEFRGKSSSRTLIVEPAIDPDPIVFRGVLAKSGTWVAMAAPMEENEASKNAVQEDTAYTVRGTLRTAGGKPVPGATIIVWQPERSGYQEKMMSLVQGGDFSIFLAFGFTDGQGRRQVKMWDQYYGDKIGKTWYLVVDAAGFARPKPIEFTFAKEIKPLTIVLERAVYVAVRGRAVDAKGQPVAKANVSVSLNTVGEAVEEPWGPEYLTDKDGRFELKQVYVGNRFAVHIDKEHYAVAVSPRMLVENAKPIDLGDLRLSAPAALPTPAQILEKLQARRDSVKNLLIEASWEEYQNDKPSSWEDGTIYKDKQGRIRVRYYYGPGALASADKKHATLDDETYNGKFTVNTREDPALDRAGNPLPPGGQAAPANRYRSTMIYNGKWPGDQVNAESHRNPLKCMDLSVISDLSTLLAAGKTATVEPVKGQPGVYELGYELDPKHDPDRLKHRVLVDAGKGWVVTRHEQFFPDGKSARLSTCDYRRGEDGWWLPTTGQFRYLWGKEVPGLDWRFNTKRVVINDPRFDEKVFQPELKGFPLPELTESVAGVVVDPDGKPVEGVSVRADLHSGSELLMAFPGKPTGKDGRFAIDGLPNKPIPIMAFIEPSPDSKDHVLRFPAEVTAKPGQKDLRIVLDPKLVRGRK